MPVAHRRTRAKENIAKEIPRLRMVVPLQPYLRRLRFYEKSGLLLLRYIISKTFAIDFIIIVDRRLKFFCFLSHFMRKCCDFP